MTTVEGPTDGWAIPVPREVSRQRTARPPTSAGRWLRRMLIGGDITASAVGWAIPLWTGPGIRVLSSSPLVRPATFVVLVAATVALVASQRLYLSRVCAIRAVEISRLGRAAALAGVAALLAPRFLPLAIDAPVAVFGAVLNFTLLNVARGGFRTWLQVGRRRGRFLRPVVIVGANDEGYDLCKLVRDHPETGFSVAAVAGESPEDVVFPSSLPRLALRSDLADKVKATGANGVLIASSAMHREDLNRHVRAFLKAELHVHMSSGLRGVDHRRLRSQPLAHEPLFYVERISLAPWQVATKRIIDVVGAVLAGIILGPVLAVAAIAIKCQGPGPVFFRQRRVGRDGVEFTIIKFRTMIPNAAAMYNALAETHAGREGPLIKISNDPRRTKVGRILERLSIDELPQLWNVIRGEMSLVGPRPAQASEIAAFDEELRGRLAVWPGITGLWQVEARDNPSFTAYRRYDLFYIENWSVSLDLAILVATLQQVAIRGINFFVRRNSEELVGATPRPPSALPGAGTTPAAEHAELSAS